ncbi:MAG: class I SAM-dependent methyltransferase family protein [Candidatus Micrarchaeia archaeon]|jgi:tRNA (guanine37-N1)-methyltransferase
MVLCAKVKREGAEKERIKLVQAGALDNLHIPARGRGYVYFPVVGKPAGLELVQKKLEKRSERPKTLREALAGKLSAQEMEELVTSFDLVGDIAVVEVPPAVEGKERLIAAALQSAHHNVRVVAKKTGGTAGEYRIRPVKVIAGEKRTHTIYREGGCEFELDLNKTYFSPRLGTERGRLAALVRPGERVLVPFAGVGPFAIRIAKKEQSAKVAGIELNPDAHGYFVKNIARNKLANCEAVLGDAGKIMREKYAGWADRVAMPLPKDASHFLPDAIRALRRGGMLHYYSFGKMEAPFVDAERDVLEAAKRQGRKARIAFRRVVRPYSKNTEQVVVDARMD